MSYLVLAVATLAVLTVAVLVVQLLFERSRRAAELAAHQRVMDTLNSFVIDVDRRLVALDSRQDDLLTEAREARKSSEAGTKLLTRQFALVRDRQARLEQVLDALRTQPLTRGRDQ